MLGSAMILKLPNRATVTGAGLALFKVQTLLLLGPHLVYHHQWLCFYRISLTSSPCLTPFSGTHTMRGWTSCAAACWLCIAWTDAALSNGSVTTTSFSAAPIATIIGGLNIVPTTLIDFAATYLAQVANDYQQSIVEDLVANSTDLEKLVDPEAYYSYGQSPPVYPSRMYPAK